MISRTTLLCYGFISMPLAAAFITLQILVPTYYAQVTSLSLATVGAIILIARLCDTLTDPLVGWLSDKTPQHWGRRRSWVLLSIPLIIIASYYLFNPSTGSASHYLLIWTLAIYVAGTMAIIPSNAWGAELSQDYHERNRVVAWRTSFGLLGTLLALSIVALSGADPDSEAMQKSLWGITLLVITGLAIGALLLPKVPDDKPIVLPTAQLASWLQLLKQASPFRRLLLSFFSNSIGNAIPATLFLFYVADVLQAKEYAGPLLFLYFIVASLSVPFWVAMAKRFDKHRTWSASIILACCFFLWTPFLGPGDIGWYLLIVIATGFTTGCDLVIPSSMNGDVVEWDNVHNGYRRPGVFFALWGTSTKLAFALAIGITFPLLDFMGFTADGNNSGTALSTVAWMYGLPCILFKLLALIGMYRYPITQENYKHP